MATNSKEYLEIASHRQGTDTAAFDLDMPSGAVWRVLPISLQAYIVSGRLPMHLLEGISSIKKIHENASSLMDKMSGNDVIAMYSIVRDVMLSNVLEPKISLEPQEGSIRPDQILPEDFDFFTNFVLSGGQAQQNSFRKTPNKKRRSASNSRPSRKASK